MFIYPVIYEQASDPYAEAAAGRLGDLASGKLEAATCWLTWDEIAWTVRRLVGAEQAKMQGRAFLDLPNLKMLDIDSKVIFKAQELLLSSHELRPRDAIHGAAALTNGIHEILSQDADFDVIRELKRTPLVRSDS